MSLLTPLALGLSAVAIPIVLMYVLKLRRQEQPVSSTLLWRRALDDVQANAPWQRLRPSVLLLLQLLAVAALVLAVAGPAYSRSHAFSGDVVVVIDQSYGMQGRDVAPSRFAATLARAHSIAGDLGSGNVMSVIGMGAQPHLAIGESGDGGAIGRAIDSLHVTASPPNVLGALSLAASLARSGASTRVIVLTSRDSGITGLPLTVPFEVDVIRFGGRLRDLGITAFQASHGGGHTEAVLRVSNFGAHTESSDLNFYVDGQLADVRPLSIAPGREQNLFWTSLPADTVRLEARLTHRDDIDADKAAWTLAPQSTTRRVLLVTSGDFFLQTALALDPSVILSTVRPNGYTPDLAGKTDLVVFDGRLPAALPATSTLLVAPSGGRVGPLRFGAPATVGRLSPATIATGELGSVLQHVDLGDVHIARARTLGPADWLQPLVTSGGRPIVAAGDDGGTRVAVLPFNLQESDWPLRISFPIMLHNLLTYLTPNLALDTASLTVGGPVKLSPPTGTRVVQITRPDGVVDRLRPPFPPFVDTSRPGIYTARTVRAASQQSAAFAVNFFPARAAAASGPQELRFGASAGGKQQVVSVPVSVAWTFGLLALALLSFEWWYAFRR
ncbi:MAG TPA: BatA and WFA domain-containing protein [Chloroflexota bacterium]